MAVCRAVVTRLEAIQPTYVAVTGDITDHGELREWHAFKVLFRRLWPKLVLVPGNHDRGADNIAQHVMPMPTAVLDTPTVQFFRLDSTYAGNAVSWVANGVLPSEAQAIARQTLEVPKTKLPVVLLHHHLRTMRDDGIVDLISNSFRLPFMMPVEGGQRFLNTVSERALILHGHKHSGDCTFGAGPPCYNGGSTTELGAFRVFTVNAGRLESEQWVSAL